MIDPWKRKDTMSEMRSRQAGKTTEHCCLASRSGQKPAPGRTLFPASVLWWGATNFNVVGVVRAFQTGIHTSQPQAAQSVNRQRVKWTRNLIDGLAVGHLIVGLTNPGVQRGQAGPNKHRPPRDRGAAHLATTAAASGSFR